MSQHQSAERFGKLIAQATVTALLIGSSYKLTGEPWAAVFVWAALALLGMRLDGNEVKMIERSRNAR